MKLVLSLLTFLTAILSVEPAQANSCTNYREFTCPQGMEKVCDIGLKLWTDDKNGWRLTNNDGKDSLYHNGKEWCYLWTDKGFDGTEHKKSDEEPICGQKLVEWLGQGSGQMNHNQGQNGQQTQQQQKAALKFKLDSQGNLLVSAPNGQDEFDNTKYIRIHAIQPSAGRLNKDNTKELEMRLVGAGPKENIAYVQREMGNSAPVDSCPKKASHVANVDLSKEYSQVNGSAQGFIGASTTTNR